MRHATAGRTARRSVLALSVSPLLDRDLVTRKLIVRERDVVFVKGIFEASEGLCAMFAERGGDLLIAAPHTREAELDELLHDLVRELEAVLETVPSGAEARG
jgi:hypothetical protein